MGQSECKLHWVLLIQFVHSIVFFSLLSAGRSKWLLPRWRLSMPRSGVCVCVWTRRKERSSIRVQPLEIRRHCALQRQLPSLHLSQAFTGKSASMALVPDDCAYWVNGSAPLGPRRRLWILWTAKWSITGAHTAPSRDAQSIDALGPIVAHKVPLGKWWEHG